MMHERRRWCLQAVGSPEDLAEKLTQHTWTRCSAFTVSGHEHIVFLNDATSEDGAQEYGVVLWCDVGRGRIGIQIESVTFSWCTEQQALQIISQLLAGKDRSAMAKECSPRVETPAQHGRCPNCA